MSDKRSASSSIHLGNMLTKFAKVEEQQGQEKNQLRATTPHNPYLSRPAKPDQALYTFLLQAIQTAKRHLPTGVTLPAKEVR
jgi:hypothetical protein